jgi:hypothetical protein
MHRQRSFPASWPDQTNWRSRGFLDFARTFSWRRASNRQCWCRSASLTGGFGIELFERLRGSCWFHGYQSNANREVRGSFPRRTSPRCNRRTSGSRTIWPGKRSAWRRGAAVRCFSGARDIGLKPFLGLIKPGVIDRMPGFFVFPLWRSRMLGGWGVWLRSIRDVGERHPTCLGSTESSVRVRPSRLRPVV